MKNLGFKFIRNVLLVVIVTFLGSYSHARDYANNDGYTSDPAAERNEVITDLKLISPPAPLGPPLQQQIFDQALTKDFRERYEQKFGRTEEERIYSSPNRFTYYNDLYNFKGSPQEEDGEKKAFAGYMMRKLVEYHVENYAKNDPKARPLWEAKQKFSQMQAGGKSFKIRAKYDIVGGKADVDLQNPWVNTKYTLDLSGTKVKESYLVLSRPITSSITVEGRYKQVEGILAMIWSKTFTKTISGNITLSTYTNHSTISTRESLYLAGASYVF